MEPEQAERVPRRARSPAAGAGVQLALFDVTVEARGRPRMQPRTQFHHGGPRHADRSRLQLQHTDPEHLRGTPLSAVARLFERLYNAFRMKMFDSMGPRYGRLLREAEREVRFLNLEFDTDSLTDATAPTVLDLIEAVIRRAPFFQKAQLRKSACLLISDLYEKHYELLRSAGVLSRLEDIYYRLKR